ncbi:hypothetical protein [Ornithinibacillus californiensis]|uniref:hypothetical protein n=1 Tax=Ornithinibacillus californiensis TaxID=161536 RepID=UPI00064D91E1|nr:hypothetical protein [Ornithinibacillus californiensis]
METMPNTPFRKTILYLISKLSGAGFLASIFAVYVLLVTEMDWFEFSEAISGWFFWVMPFVYGIVSSMIIDLIKLKLSNKRRSTEIGLYILFGFIPFIIYMEGIMFTIIAGSIGAASALLFLFGIYLTKQSKILRYVVAFVIPIVLIIMANIDFTTKVNWKEEQTNLSYQATFDYFNGKHEIPIEAQQGQIILFSVEFTNENGGGHGYHVRNRLDNYMGMEETVNQHAVEVPEDGIYRIIINGDGIKGKVEVDWEIRDNN